ncbi:MAG: hypothetical protein Q9205_004540 [Flavoplaca limonia]
MFRFSKSKSSTSLSSRPSQPPVSPSSPEPTSRPGYSSTAQKAPSPLPNANPANEVQLTITSIRAQWTLGLTQHNDFQLHAALQTFRRLLKALKIATGGSPSPIKEASNFPPSFYYRILLPREVALLFINIGLIQAYLGQYYLAGQAFREALVLDPDSAVAWFGLGIAKFYSSELSASQRAFKKCQRCFLTWHADGYVYQQDELIYNVWPGQPDPPNQTTTSAAENHDSGSSAIGLDLFKGIMSSRLPNNQWKLELLRTEWNYRAARERSTSLKARTENPQQRSLTGIPAGVIFGLDEDTTRNQSTGDQQTGNSDIGVQDSTRLDIFDTSPANDIAKDTTGDHIKRLWTGLKGQFLSREPNTLATQRTRPRRWGRSQSLPSLMFSSQLTSAVMIKQTPTQADLRYLPVIIYYSPRPSPLHPPQALPSPDNDNFEDLELADDYRTKSSPEDSPVRQSSLASPSSKPSRRSRGVSLLVNTAIERDDKLEKEPPEAGSEPVSQPHPLRSRDSAEISPCEISQGIYNGSLKPEFLRPDFTVVEDIKRERSASWSSAKSPNLPPAEYLHNSFSTDAISSLASGMPSAFFGKLPDGTEYERRPGKGTTYSWSAGEEGQEQEEQAKPIDEAKDEDMKKEGKEEESQDVHGYYGLEERAMVTITPATPSVQENDSMTNRMDSPNNLDLTDGRSLEHLEVAESEANFDAETREESEERAWLEQYQQLIGVYLDEEEGGPTEVEQADHDGCNEDNRPLSTLSPSTTSSQSFGYEDVPFEPTSTPIGEITVTLDYEIDDDSPFPERQVDHSISTYRHFDEWEREQQEEFERTWRRMTEESEKRSELWLQQREEENREDTRVWMEELRALGHFREVEEEEVEGYTDNFDDGESDGDYDGPYNGMFEEYDEHHDENYDGKFDEEYSGEYDDNDNDNDNGSRGEIPRPVAYEG